MTRTSVFALGLVIVLMVPFAGYAQHDHHGGMQQMGMPSTKAEAKDHIFISYEEARQALLNESLPNLKSAAKHLSVSAHSADQHKISELAATLEKSADLTAARAAFATLSDEVIKYRDDKCCGDKPVVMYCKMEKKSWLQPGGTVGNPYVDAGMRTCGELREQ